MARIPDSTSLMGRDTSLRPTGGIVEGPQDFAAVGMQRLGQGVERLATGIGEIARERESQQNTLDGTMADAHWRSGVMELDGRYRHENDQDHATWTKRYQDDVRKRRDEAAAKISDPQRRQLFVARTDGEIAQRVIGIDERAKEIARRQGRVQLDEAQEQQFGAVMAPNAQPADSEKGMAALKASIDSAVRTGMMTPEEGEKRWQNFQRRRAGLAVEREIEADPEGAAIRLGTGQVASRANRAMAVLMGKGWTKEQAAGVVGRLFQESGMNPQAVNPRDGRDGSDSIGIMQWNADRAQALRAFARERGKDWSDFDTQIEFIDHEMRGRESRVGAMLRAAKTPEEAARAAMSFARPRGWTAENPEAGHGWDNTVRRARQMAGASGVESPAYRFIRPEDRERLGQRVDRALQVKEADQRLAREEIRSMVRDDMASMEATGAGIEALTRDRVAQVMGEPFAAEWERDRTRAKTYHETIRDFDAMPAEQIDRRVEAMRPEGGKEGFADDQKAYERIRKEADRVIEQRQQDPAASVGRTGKVREAESQMRAEPNNPERWRALSRARIEAQRAVGIPEQTLTPITSREAAALAQPLIDATARSPQEVNVALQNLQAVLERNFGEHADEAMVYILQTATMSRETAEAAHNVLRKIIRGQNPTQADLQAVDQAAANAAAQAAVSPFPEPTPPGQRRSTTGAMSRAMRRQDELPMPPVQDMDPNASTRSRRPSDEALKALRDGQVTEQEFDAVFGKGAAKKVMPILKSGRAQ